MNYNENDGYKLLIKALVAIDNEDECVAFLEDLMTKKELGDITQRLEVAKLLSEQTVYNKIVEKTGASTATISRVNRAYLYGEGGYGKILKKIGED
jgi:TrpR-related protein YerC/YecD